MAIIHTKYSVGDQVYFMKNNKIEKATIVSLQATSTPTKDHWHTIYSLGNARCYHEVDLFRSKEELLSSL